MHHFQSRQQQSLAVKVALLTVFFSMLWLILFYEHPEPDYKADHMHDMFIDAGQRQQYEQVDILSDKVDQDMQNLAEELLDDGRTHNSATDIDFNDRYSELCSIYSDLCDKTTRDGGYSEEDIFVYQLLMVYLIKQVDQRLVDHPTIRSTLSRLIHFQSAEGRRGSAGHTHIRLNTEKIDIYQEYRNVLTHELGHVLDLGSVKGRSTQKNSTYTEFGDIQWSVDDPSLDFYKISWKNEDVRKADASFEDFVSGYGMQGIYEDFAETFNMYFNHHALLVELAKNNDQIALKYQFMSDLMDGEYYRLDTKRISAIEGDKRPWDSTKIGL